MKLDRYQVEALKEVREKMYSGCGVMLQMPTGSGKTEVGIALLKVEEAIAPGQVHGWLTHREELRAQSSSRISATGMPVSVMADIPAAKRHWFSDAVNVVSPQMRKWPEIPPNPGLLIVDEAHHTPASTWSRLVDAWQIARGTVVGLTATPWRLSRRQGFEDWYDSLVCGPQVIELQEANYLATPKVVSPHNSSINTENGLKSYHGDFDFHWMQEEVLMLLHMLR